MSVPEAAVVLVADALEAGAAEEAAAGGVDVVVVPGLPPHPARAAVRINAPSPKLSGFFMSSSFDEPAGMDRR